MKRTIGRRLALLFSLLLLLTSTVQTTYGLIITETEPLVNTFVPTVTPDPDDTAVTVTVHKTVTNTGALSIGPRGFQFMLENTDTGEQTTVESDKNGQAVFTLIYSATDIGQTYRYTLREVNNGRIGVTYDTRVYELTVAVAETDGQLTMALTNDGVTVETFVAEFENIYHADEPISPPTGDTAGTVFWFALMVISGTAFAVLLNCERRARTR